MSEQNRTSKPRWLIVSYYANVDGRAASHHVDDRVSALRASGIDVTVLSSTRGPRYCNEQHLRIFSLMPSAVLDELKSGFRRNRRHRLPTQVLRLIAQVLITIPVALLYIVERLLLRRDKRWSWQFTAAARGWLWSRSAQPDLILSTGGPASAHVAGNWLAQRLEVPLVCEFQDPLPFQYPPSDKRIHDYHLKLEQTLAGNALALVYLTDGAVDAAKQRLSTSSCKVPGSINPKAALFSIISGAPAVDLAAKVADHKRVLAHVGTLSGTRNLDTLLAALTALAAKDAQLHTRFTLRLVGSIDRAVVHSIKSFVLKDSIDILGRQPRDTLDSIIESADILLLVQNTGPIAKETIPSKAFEYLQTGRPILGLIDGNRQLHSILAEHGHSVYELGDDNSILQQQLKALLYTPLPQVKPCRLTVQHSVDELIRSIDSLL